MQPLQYKANSSEKESMMTKYQAHQARKERIRHHKATDKLRAIENPESIW